jgi:prenylcysteine oxidase/farnesylcysteine lyase
LSFYASESPKWENISELAYDLDWALLVNTTTEEYLLTQGVSEKYIGEVVEAATRVNYGQVWMFISKLMLSDYCAEC